MGTISSDAQDAIIELAYKHILGRAVDAPSLPLQRTRLSSIDALPDFLDALVFSAEARPRQLTCLAFAALLGSLEEAADPVDLDSALNEAARRHLVGRAPGDFLIERTGDLPESGPEMHMTCAEVDGALSVAFYAMGCAGQDALILNETTNQRRAFAIRGRFFFRRASLASAGSEPDVVRAAIPDAGLEVRTRLHGRVFFDTVNFNLRERSDQLVELAELGQRPTFEHGEGLIDARLGVLYAAQKGRTLESVMDDRQADTVLGWYINEWSETPHCPEKFDLNERQVAFLKSPAIDSVLVGYPVSRMIFYFAQKNRRLDDLLGSHAGMIQVYIDFLFSRLYKRVAHLDLIPPAVLMALNVPVSLQGEPLNVFWFSALEHELGGKSPRDLPHAEVVKICAEKFCYCLLNGFFEGLIPREWFDLYRSELVQARADGESFPADSSGKALRNGEIDAVALRRAAVTALLRESDDAEAYGRGAAAFVEKFERAFYDKIFADTGYPVTLVSHGGGSGLAKNAVMFRDALEKANVAMRRVDVDTFAIHDFDASGTRRGFGTGVNIFSVNADRFSTAVTRVPMIGGHKAPNVGFFLWETTRAPRSHLLARDGLDEIWVPTEFVKSIYDDLFDGAVPVVNVRKHIAVPTDIKPYPFSNFGIGGSEFVFLNITDFDSSIIRKNPLPAVQAFRKAFPDDPDVRLILKVRKIEEAHWSNQRGYWSQVISAIGDDPRILILTGNLPESDYWSLLKSADCYVSLHRAEGFGYGAAHSMLLDVPVITTDFSGTQDFCTSKTAFPVAVDLVDVRPGEMIFHEDLGQWAVPDVDSAAQQMRKVREGGSKVADVVKAAHAKVADDYSFERFTGTVLGRVKALTG